MSERMTHEEYVTIQRRRVADLARQILAREIDVLDGSVQIAVCEMNWKSITMTTISWLS